MKERHARGLWPYAGVLAGMLMPMLYGHAALAVEDVLPPDQVFHYKVVAGQERLEVQMDVEPGYYLYRDRFRFTSPTPGVILGEPEFPEGEIHSDEFFGEQVIHRREFVIGVPYQAGEATRQMQLDLRLQGCADFGLCYPPQDWQAMVELPPRPASPAQARGRELSGLLGSPAEDGQAFLPPDEAFVLQAALENDYTIRVGWQIAEGYYLYRDKFGFSTDSQLVQLGVPRLPGGEITSDEYFGESEVYYREVDALIPFSRAGPGAGEFTLTVEYQGCAVDGICYPPIGRELALRLPAADSGALPAAPAAPVSEQDRLARLIRDGRLLPVLATFFGLGLLLAFTPCVLPMVPILSGIIVGHGKDISTAKATSLAVAYVLGMALTYTVAGAAFAAAGQTVQAVFQKPWIIVTFSLLFVGLALAMFGLYELQVPASLQTRLSSLSNRQKSGGYAGTVIMGALSALIVSACVAPPLVATLAVIGQTGDIMRGSSALFAMSMGMGAPLIVFGASAGKLLPKAGAWMESIKAFFGFLLLAVAAWMLDRVLPGWSIMLLWSGLALAFGLFLGALQPLPEGSGIGARFGKALGLMSATYGILLLIGLASGSESLLRPLAALGSTTRGESGETALEFRPIKSLADLERTLEQARAADQTVMLDFYADWCVSCKEMEHYTFTDASVIGALRQAVLVQADVTANDTQDQELLRHFGIFGPPTIAFFGADGQERTAYRVVGFMPAEEFAAHARSAFASPPGHP